MARIEISPERCKSCGLCAEACKEECIVIEGEFNSAGYQVALFIGADKCKGCAICAEMCPDVAIEVYK